MDGVSTSRMDISLKRIIVLGRLYEYIYIRSTYVRVCVVRWFFFICPFPGICVYKYIFHRLLYDIRKKKKKTFSHDTESYSSKTYVLSCDLVSNYAKIR